MRKLLPSHSWQIVSASTPTPKGVIKIENSQYTYALERAHSQNMRHKGIQGEEISYEHKSSRGLRLYLNKSLKRIRIEASNPNDLENLTDELRLPRTSAEF